MVEVQENVAVNKARKVLKGPYRMKTLLEILCFLKERENLGLQTYGRDVKNAFGLGEEVYKILVNLEKDGKIDRYFVGGRKRFITLTKEGEKTVHDYFFRLFARYENLVEHVIYNSVKIDKLAIDRMLSEIKRFVKNRGSGNYYDPERYLANFNHDLLEFLRTKFDQSADLTKSEVRRDDL